MTSRNIKILAIVLLLVVSVASCSANSEVNPAEQTSNEPPPNINNNLEVHFIDVGQADAILIKGSNNENIMIDAGNNGDSELVVNYIKKQGVENFKAVIGTHPHEDHIGGLDAVINNFNVEKVYIPKVTHTTKTFKDVITAIKNKELKVTAPEVGSTINIGDAEAIILAPNSSEYEDFNNYSIVLKLTHGSNFFIFTGDAEDISEKEILKNGLDISADVLKVGHHGSHSSTTAEFLDKVNPKYAIIMCEKGNDYGHPHKETMEKLNNKGIAVYRTDINGTIVAVSDRNSITYNVDKEEKELGNNQANTYNENNSEEKVYVNSNRRGLIKGNINSKGEKIYHMPDGAYYDKTKPEEWFKTESEAQASGFRRSGR